MFARVVLAVGFALCVASTAAAQKVKTDFDPAVDFSKFTTYYWHKTDPSPNDLQNQRMVTAVDSWLTAKGWSKVEPDKAQIAIVPVVTTQQQQSLNTYYDTMGGGWGYGGWYGGGMGMGSSTTTVNTYTQGTLIIDLYDKSSKKLVWRGIATDTISDDPKKVAQKIQKAVEKMFKSKFPPGQGG